MGNRKIGRHSRHNAVDLLLLLRNYLLPDSRKMRVRWQALWKNLLPCEASKHYVTSVPTYVGKNSKPKGVGERGTPLPKTAKRPARHHCAWTMRLAIVCFRFFSGGIIGARYISRRGYLPGERAEAFRGFFVTKLEKKKEGQTIHDSRPWNVFSI